MAESCRVPDQPRSGTPAMTTCAAAKNRGSVALLSFLQFDAASPVLAAALRVLDGHAGARLERVWRHGVTGLQDRGSIVEREHYFLVPGAQLERSRVHIDRLYLTLGGIDL